MSYSRVSALTDHDRDRLRDLTFGRDAESPMYRWTHHSEAWCTRAAIWNAGVIGWSCLTLQDDYLPVAGVYVASSYRGRGIARALATYLLSALAQRFHAGMRVQAVSELWPKWPTVIRSVGFEFVEWA